MRSFDDIHDMIATAYPGDGDRMLDICQALLENLRNLSRQVEVLDFSKVDAGPRTARVATPAEELRERRERFAYAECLKGHITRTATAMDLDAFEKALCPQWVKGERCGATLTIGYRAAQDALARS